MRRTHELLGKGTSPVKAMKYARFIIALLFISGVFAARSLPVVAAAAQGHGSLAGSVSDSAGDPIAGAVIRVTGPVQRSTESDSSGHFKLEDIPAGYYAVSVIKAGFLPARSANVAVFAGQRLPLNVRLIALSASSLQVIARVVATGKSSINTGTAQTTFVPRSSLLDLANPQINDVVARIPGAGIERGSSSPNTSISLGGAQPYETQVLLDGHPLSGGRYGVWFSQFFSSFMLQGIQADTGPGNTTPFAASAIGGTANLLTPTFTAKPTFEFIDGVDNYASQYSNALMTGSIGRLSYVLDAGYQGLNGEFFQHYGCVIKPQSYPALNTSNAAGIVQFCGDLSGPLTTKGEIVKFRYDFSKSTSLETGFVGSQAGYNPQGTAYGQYGGMVTVLPCMTVGSSQQCSNPNDASLIGTQIPGYVFYPGSVVNNNQPIFDAQLRTTLGDNTLLVRPYLGSISRSINGSGEANYPDHYTAGGVAVMQSPFSLLESDKLRGTTFSFVHPFGNNVVTANYDYHSDETFAYYGSPSAVNTPDTISRFNTISLAGDFAATRDFTIRAALYETNWQLQGQQSGPIVSGKPTLIPSSRSVSRFDPHIAFVLQPRGDLSYRLAVGTSATYPFASQVSGIPFITPGSATAPYGTLNNKNPLLNPETATSIDVGMDKRFRNDAVLSFDFLGTNVRNVFETIITPTVGPIDPVKGTPEYSAVLQPANVASLAARQFTATYGRTPAFGLGYSLSGTLASSIVNGVPASFYTSPTAFVQPANGQQQCSNGGSEICLPYLKGYLHLQYIAPDRTYYALDGDFEGKNNTYNQPPFTIFSATVRHPVTKTLDVQISVQNLLNTNVFFGLPEFNLGVPQIGQSSTGLGSILTPLIPAPARTFRLQLRWHIGR